ncbi:MAG: four helix bundle protein [Candidatus Margulisiibacteriota bacterium]
MEHLNASLLSIRTFDKHRSNAIKCSNGPMFIPGGGAVLGFLFENLVVNQKAVAVAIEISKLTDNFPKGNYYLVDQINRAAISISLNIAEGNGRFTQKDRNNFFYIARGSAFECVPLLKILSAKKMIDEDKYAHLLSEIEAVSKMLSGLIKKY